jgi:ABC-type multidrug transport system fused ATPase/permease subunit
MIKPLQKTINLLGILRQLRPYVKQSRGLVILTLVLTFLGALTAQVNPLVLQYTVDKITALAEMAAPMSSGIKTLSLVTILLLAKEVVSIFINIGQKYYAEKIRANISTALSKTAIDRILTYRVSFFTNEDHHSGKLQTRIDRGVESLTRLVQNFFIDILPLLFSACMALFIMFSQNVYIGLVAACILPLYFYISSLKAKRLAGVRRQLRQERELKSAGLINLIQSIMVIKSFVREQYEGTKQNQLQESLRQKQLSTRKVNFLYDGVKNFVEQIGVVAIILLTVYLVLNQELTVGAIILNILLFNNVASPIRQLHGIYDDMNDALIYAESFFEVINANDEQEPNGVITHQPIKGHFALENVHFKYENGSHALHAINMDIQAGKTTALVGLSGAGKSTLISLLSKFYWPTAGVIKLDGRPLNDYENAHLRDAIGIVLQRNHIFQGSIEDNIRYGQMDAPFSAVVEAAKKAFLHDQIMALPSQYKHDATQLSGGQQQRIAIARLFLKNPPIIFLDEPTASLDAMATEHIKNSLDAIKEGRTVIIISHSLSQIIDADTIYVMEKGSIKEVGTHDSLYERKGLYTSIFNASARSLNLDRMVKTFQSQ